MARQIKIDQIDDLMKEAVQELVQKTTLQWTALAKKATPVGETGNLRNDWKTDIQKLRGTIITEWNMQNQLYTEQRYHLVGKVDLEQDNRP